MFPILEVPLMIKGTHNQPSEDDDEAEDSESFRRFFLKFLASKVPAVSRSGGNLSKIFLGFKHQSCSGRMQFQSTQGNHKAIPISMVRKMISWVFRLVRLTLQKERIQI